MWQDFDITNRLKQSWTLDATEKWDETYELLVVKVTRSNETESPLLLRLAEFVVVGDPHWHAHATSYWASAPRGALSDAALRLRYHSWARTHPPLINNTNIPSHWVYWSLFAIKRSVIDVFASQMFTQKSLIKLFCDENG